MTVLAHPAGGNIDSPDRIVAEFKIRYRRFLDPDGRAVVGLPEFAADPAVMIPIYRAMVLTRVFDAKAVSMQRTGRIGTYPSSLGQEAATVGVAAAMHEEDVLLPTYREHGALHWRGVAPLEMLQFWGGAERGLDWSGPAHDFPPAVPIASQCLHAAGVATAMKLRNEARCAVCFLGDGATSKGDFHEAVNLAGVWNLPVVFVVNNNGWAISLPLGEQTAAETLAQKALAGGINGEQADGNDAVAVRQVASEAIERARSGDGPGLIELMTYRLSDHTTADDASRYRGEEAVSAEWANDPISRLRAFIGEQGWWTKEDEEALLTETAAGVEEAKTAYAALQPEPPTAMFDYLYETPPEPLLRQRRLVEEGGEHD